MTTDRKQPTGPPPSAGVLARYAQAHARELGVAEGRVRAWIAYMIMAGALERATGADGLRFILKGGVALELRLRDRARATKDIDIREACELVFRSRNTHAWPPNLDAMPPHWTSPFAQLAEELQLRETDVGTALTRVRRFVERILASSS